MSKEEPDNHLCRCCHSEGVYASLYANCWLESEEIVYHNVLQECFDIELAPVSPSARHRLCGICDACQQKLEEAIQFKRQVQKCERRFRDVYANSIIEEPTIEVEVKIKEEPDDINDVLSPAYNRPPNHHNEAKKKKSDEFKDDDDDDDRFNDPDDDMEYKPSEDEKDAALEVKDEADEMDRKSRRLAQMGPEAGPLKVFSEPMPVRKRGRGRPPLKKRGKLARVKNNPNSSDDDEDLEYVDGVSVIKAKLSPVKRNIDFKLTEDGYQCIRCPVILKTDNTMRRHIHSIHFNSVKFKCPTCLEGFKSFGGLVKHKLEKHNIDHRFKCNACDKTFFENQFLKDHYDAFHMMGEKRKCKVCEFETYSKVSFYKHKIKHLSVKNHQCKYCQKAFKRKTYLVLHERIHTGDKRKVCTECGEAYIDRTSLRYHMTRRHPEINF